MDISLRYKNVHQLARKLTSIALASSAPRSNVDNMTLVSQLKRKQFSGRYADNNIHSPLLLGFEPGYTKRGWKGGIDTRGWKNSGRFAQWEPAWRVTGTTARTEKAGHGPNKNPQKAYICQDVCWHPHSLPTKGSATTFWPRVCRYPNLLPCTASRLWYKKRNVKLDGHVEVQDSRR